jgi:hypothetical protein
MARCRHSPRKRVALVAEGVGEANEPGIPNPDREYGFGASAKRRILRCAIAHRGMTKHSPNARNPAKLAKSRRARPSLDFPGFVAMVRATFGKSERSYA